MMTSLLVATCLTKQSNEDVAQLLFDAMPSHVRSLAAEPAFKDFVRATGLTQDVPFISDALKGDFYCGSIDLEGKHLVSFGVMGSHASLSITIEDGGHIIKYQMNDPRVFSWENPKGPPGAETLRQQALSIFKSVWTLGGLVSLDPFQDDHLAAFSVKVLLDQRRLFNFFNAAQVEICPKNGVATLVMVVRQRPVERRSPREGELAAAQAEMLPRFLNTFGAGLYRMHDAELTYQPVRPGGNYVPTWTIGAFTIDPQGRITGGYELSIHADTKAVIRELDLGHPMGRSESIGPFSLDGVWSDGGARYRLEPASEDFESKDILTLRREHFVLHGNYSKERSLVKVGDDVYRLVPAP